MKIGSKTRCLLILLLGLACLPALAAAPSAVPVDFKAADGVIVHGVYRQVAEPKALILLFHQAGSNHGEYATIAPRLAAAGYSTLAIDQRSGGDMFGTRNATARAMKHEAGYLDAEADLEAALRWAHADGRATPVILWGSSYSAALVFRVAAAHPDAVAALLSFSPGEYLGQPRLVRDAAAKATVPVFITSAKDDEEIANAKAILDAVASTHKTQFVPKTGGVHGSSTLRADRDATGADENWKAVFAFLDALPLPR